MDSFFAVQEFLLALFVGWCGAAICLELKANRKCRTHA